MNSVFLDTNFFLDVFDSKRERHSKAKQILEQFLDMDIKLYTSSDIISTISYFLQKKLDLKACVVNIDFIVQEISTLSAENSDFIALNQLILEKIEKDASLNIDYEDCMQMYLAHKFECHAMLTSDKHFCKGIKEAFCVEVIDLDGCFELFVD